MPILHFTDRDLLSSKLLESGGYSATVTAIQGPNKSSSGKSYNFPTTFTIRDSNGYDGKTLEVWFNTGVNQNSVLGALVLMPHTMLIHLAAATTNTKLEQVPKDLDTDSLVGLSCDISVAKIISDGVPVNQITGFLPLGTYKSITDDVPF